MGKLSLHAHDPAASHDSLADIDAMLSEYVSEGFVAVGFVGHDEKATVSHADLHTFNGTEHTVSEHPEIHVVHYPEIEFTFLSHPLRINPRDSRGAAEKILAEKPLDGVEKYNFGNKQYHGSIEGVLELANDDAHNPLQIGASYMTIASDDPTRQEVIQAVKAGEFELHNEHPSLTGEVMKHMDTLVGMVL